MRASDRPRTLYAGTGTLNELVGVAVRASLAFARVSGGMGASPRSRDENVHDASRIIRCEQGQHSETRPDAGRVRVTHPGVTLKTEQSCDLVLALLALNLGPLDLSHAREPPA
jgi:hypothetical protein